MKNLLFETDRKIRPERKKEINYLAWFFGGITLIVLVTEILSVDRADYLSNQGKAIYVFFIIFVMRLFTFHVWSQYYRETLNFLFSSIKLDSYVKISLLNVLLDLFILFCLFFWIELERVAFVNIPIAGLVYVLMIGFSLSWKKRKISKNRR
ncbi:MAG: hypothetical protein AB7W47_15445 [Calditrichaceae bacterium]